MNLTKREPFKWDPFQDLDDVSQRLNRLFGRPLARGDTGRDTMTTIDWAPSVDICETDNEYVIKAEIPDVKREV